ncbi:MAG TPA: hypothetical protein VNO22_09700 [Planctomycetota bacterium]|nr:hypothetical protein [Planctomycetota bacterium]
MTAGTLYLVLSLLPCVQSAEEFYKDLKVGDRIRVTFRSGNTITGLLAPPPTAEPPKKAPPRSGKAAPAEAPAPEPVDFSKLSALTLDLSWEYPGLNGTLTIEKKDVRSIEKLQNLDPATLKRLAEEKKKIQEDLARQNEELRKEAERREKEARELAERLRKEEEEKFKALGQEKELAEKLDRVKKYKEVLARFPPSAGWGPERLQEISRKAQLKLPVTLEERAFAENFQLWNEAVAAQKEASKEEKKPEEKKP